MDLDDEIVLATIRAELRENSELIAACFAFTHGAARYARQYDAHLYKGERMQMKAVGVYTIKGGKIVREEFFYTK